MPIRSVRPLLHRFTPLLATAALLGCDSTTLTTAETNDALIEAQCTLQNDRAAARACFEAFKSCKTAENADLAACRATLDGCLPPPPRGDGEGGCSNEGADGGEPHGGGRGGPRGAGGRGGPDGEGPHGPPPDGGRPPHGGRGGPRGGPRGAPLPESADIEACRTALTACIADGSQSAELCQSTEHDCIHAAFAAAFEAQCATATATCGTTSSEDCTRIAERCSRGIDDPAPRPDGSAACATDTTYTVP